MALWAETAITMQRPLLSTVLLGKGELKMRIPIIRPAALKRRGAASIAMVICAPKNNKLSLLLIVFYLFVGLVACTSKLFEIRDNPIDVGKEAMTIDQVSTAIMDAGKGLGWKMSQVSKEEIHGTYQMSKHSATVSIPFTTRSYSILYKASSNLKYDGTRIHKRYNELITSLDAAIRRELSTVTKVSQPVKQEEPTMMRSLINWLKNIGSDDSDSKSVVTTN
jgi:hypothetical protein